MSAEIIENGRPPLQRTCSCLTFLRNATHCGLRQTCRASKRTPDGSRFYFSRIALFGDPNASRRFAKAGPEGGHFRFGQGHAPAHPFAEFLIKELTLGHGLQDYSSGRTAQAVFGPWRLNYSTLRVVMKVLDIWSCQLRDSLSMSAHTNPSIKAAAETR